MVRGQFPGLRAGQDAPAWDGFDHSAANQVQEILALIVDIGSSTANRAVSVRNTYICFKDGLNGAICDELTAQTGRSGAIRAQKEMILATKMDVARATEARARAEASFRKEERAREGAKAMMEYQANSRLVREKMERLKALRLAKEAAEKECKG